MTACVNKKSKRVAAVVTASLVGALSIGAPAVALATGTTNIETLSASEESAFSRGTVKLDTNKTGLELDSDNGVYNVTANEAGQALNVKATHVTPLGASEITLAGNDDYTVSFYKADDKFNKTGDEIANISEPGKYVVVVKAVGGTYKGGEAVAKVNVKGASLKGISYYEVDASDPYAVSDKTITYTGGKLNIGFQVNGAYLVEGQDYSVKILKAGTDNVAAAPGVDVVEYGSYVGYVTGLGQYAGESEEVPFTVARFDWSNAKIDAIQVLGSDSAPTHPKKVYTGTVGNANYAELDPSLVTLSFGRYSDGSTQLFDKTGTYTFGATVDTSNKSIKESTNKDDGKALVKNVTVYKCAAAATFTYNDEAIADSYTVDLSKKQSFNTKDIKVLNGTKEIASTGYTISVTTAATGSADKTSDLESGEPGTYTVTVSVKPNDTAVNYAVGGTKTFTVKVVRGTVDADANVYVYLKSSGKVITSFSKEYDGAAVSVDSSNPTFEVKAFDADNEEIKNADLSMTLCDKDGNALPAKSVTDAGSYILKITSGSYNLTGTTELPVTISKVDLSTIKVGKLETKAGGSYLPLKTTDYLWKELDLRYNTGVADSDDNDTATDDEGWDVLPESFLDDTYLKAEKWDADKQTWVKTSYPNRINSEGRFRITLAGTKDQSKNYKFANSDCTTTVEFKCVDKDKLIFDDVNAEEWYVDPIAEAKAAGYMSGYNGKLVFGPTKSITRGEVACVLFNMAGGDKVEVDEGYYSEIYGWKSFDDVNGKEFYGKAIAWAKNAGVVNGYGDGTFRPDKSVTREEFACMLTNFAALKGDDVEGADADLSGFGDSASVSDWALDAVEWAVENGVMGNGGFLAPANSISRAETAAMAVNYMPFWK